MQKHPGIFIVLEGSDGSGKGTQFRLLIERLKAVGQEVDTFDFPRYDEPSCYFVKRYLNGDYGPASEVSPYTASMFYALDRYEAAPHIKKALDVGKVVVANRYVGSNMAHQGVKFNSPAEQRGFFMWADSLEYQLLGIPRPNINLFLNVPPEISFSNIAKKAGRSYTKKVRDEHEADMSHIKKSTATYDLLCKLFPNDFKEINCSENGQLLGIVEINNLIWQTIKPLLPLPKRKGKGAVVSLERCVNNHDAKSNAEQAKHDSAQITNAVGVDEILEIQKQMLSRAGLIKKGDHKQLESALSLLVPLISRKKTVKDLIENDFSSRSTNVDKPVPLNQIIDRMSDAMPLPSSDDNIKLLQVDPRNEFQILDETSIAGLSYRQKNQQFHKEFRKTASKIVYNFEVITNFSSLLTFKNEVDARKISLLAASPLLGYKIPEIIETLNLEELFKRAFKISSDLYRKSASAKRTEALYSLLLGHSARWKFTIDAATLSKALKSSKNPELIVFLNALKDKVAEVHPGVGKLIGQ